MIKKYTPIQQVSYSITRWIGSIPCLIFHLLLFIISYSLIPLFGFEKILLVTTTLLSWEAIFIGIFIQMAVNRQDAKLRAHGEKLEDIEENVDDILEDTEELTEEETAV